MELSRILQSSLLSRTAHLKTKKYIKSKQRITSRIWVSLKNNSNAQSISHHDRTWYRIPPEMAPDRVKCDPARTIVCRRKRVRRPPGFAVSGVRVVARENNQFECTSNINQGRAQATYLDRSNILKSEYKWFCGL